MLSRRALVGKLAAGAAGAVVAWTASAGRAKPAFARGRTPTSPGAGEHGDELRAPAPEVHPPAEPSSTRVTDTGPPATVSSPPPWELLRPLAIGSVVAHGWRLAELTGAVDGTCVLTLRNARGRAQRVHLCRNDGRPQGLVYTKRFDLVVMNGGQGDLPTNEGFAQAVAELAHVLAANENNRHSARVVAQLLPHEERLRLFAGPVDRRLR
jgi:hypothetical protein